MLFLVFTSSRSLPLQCTKVLTFSQKATKFTKEPIFIMKDSFDEKESIHILLKVLIAVKNLHEKEIVHSD